MLYIWNPPQNFEIIAAVLAIPAKQAKMLLEWLRIAQRRKKEGTDKKIIDKRIMKIMPKKYRNLHDTYLVKIGMPDEMQNRYYTTSDLFKFATWLNGHALFRNWRYLNVYYRFRDSSENIQMGQIASYAASYPPVRKDVNESELMRYKGLMDARGLKLELSDNYLAIQKYREQELEQIQTA